MKRIIISIKRQSIVVKILDPVINDPTNINYRGINLLSDEVQTLYFNRENGVFQSDVIETDVVLTKDQIGIEPDTTPYNFASLTINREKDYLLHHSKPINCGVNEFTNRIQGEHEIGD
ncbi:MAG: hypothetical protein ACK5XN_27165, partial [Bacteroidota bacterium]